ncbi:MAG: heavy metal translocating P-type ATPase, partial [Hyphomicrobiales bacterium]|nr:heavy metal translocating P-type ATPase [Hyphomicrobiales bacterium]
MAAADFGLFLKRGRDGRAAMDFAVEGMHCAACPSRVEGAARGLPGVETARVKFGERRLHVEWREGAADPSAAMAALTRVGYRAEPFERGADEASESAEGELLLRGLAVASFAMMNVLLLSVSLWAGWASGMDRATRVAFELLSAAIAVPAIVYAGRPFWRGAAHALRGGGLNMDVPIAVGLTLTAGLSVRESLAGGRAIYFDSALMLLTFLLAGRVVDHMARARMRRAAVNVTALRGARALRIGPDDAPVETPVGALVAGDRALVRAGDRVPADS